MPEPTTLNSVPDAGVPMGERILALDALRGVAVAMVIGYHYVTRFDELYGHQPAPGFSLSGGRFGVHLFFIISGYVILLTLDRCATARGFLVARFCRLYPAFWTSLAITFAAVTLVGLPGREAPWRDALYNLTMAPEYFGRRLVDGAHWSLRWEITFYVVAACARAFGARRYLTLIMAAIVGGHLLGSGVGQFFHLFLLGIIVYESRERWRWWHAPLIVLCLVDSGRLDGWVHAATIAALGAMVWAATHLPLDRFAPRILVGLGGVSYGVYLVHQNLGFVCMRTLEGAGVSSLVAIPLTMLGAVVLGTALTLLVERPANRGLRAWFGRRSRRGTGKQAELFPGTRSRQESA